MTTKQCGTCELWDRGNIKIINDMQISDCLSDDNRSEAFVETNLDETLEKYPMISEEGQNCPVYKQIKEE